jgi:hypothetical protein
VLYSITNERLLRGVSDQLRRLENALDGRSRNLALNGKVAANGMTRSILEEHPPWSGVSVTRHPVPAMISDAERAYYVWLGTQYTGMGDVIELGPWLGASTMSILDGLTTNRCFDDRKLYVVDDFVWRSAWMDQHLPNSYELPGNHASFRSLFDDFTALYGDRMVVLTRQISPYDGNEGIPRLEWDQQTIEFAFIDCGRTIVANESWWEILSPYFVTDHTLLILQDWQTHKDVPRQHFNQMLEFTGGKEGALELLHEVRGGGVATFLYHAP